MAPQLTSSLFSKKSLFNQKSAAKERSRKKIVKRISMFLLNVIKIDQPVLPYVCIDTSVHLDR